MRSVLLLSAISLSLQASAQTAAISKWASRSLLHQQPLEQAHVGISIYEPATGKYWYQYQDDKFFTPASNTKIFALYAGLKLLGDSLPAARYYENDTAVFVKGMADPSFLHPDYTFQPLLQLLQQTAKQIYLVPANNLNKRYGPGWSWADYADDYQPELTEWPMYGNVVRIYHHGDTSKIMPALYDLETTEDRTITKISTERDERNNLFFLKYNPAYKEVSTTEVPFITGTEQELRQRLQDTLHKRIGLAVAPQPASFQLLKSIPADSLFTPMMHRSDNFFAEQTLMMASASLWDTISTKKMISWLLEGDLKDLPHAPQWVDGSGLSRYNLITPRDFVSVLNKMYAQYPQRRLWDIFATGGKGTLRNYYQQQFVHAKTGTLNGVVGLSGYLVTKKNKTLIFSVLVNNHQDTATSVRRAVERLLTMIWKEY
ncbi:D-alanyl-D-alanine carboxypeptidase / D-alanyl-D-alanine-endopeptidase (penicillin-binding protein 4) [Chitinophaga eiseniae]|uniref:D-alanyl-D-alanine carboxypeptidase / D-alanyl-D-alanine-endopeptidase (Penicillin-binding protein 4) n=1 Tax=Chitinophaga eiseniae TaxID=634771 RepID=A0A1T4RLZ8_9BACT|nr:D-alanyl-D-alanine carboxypeptidase [Chitinophaga eiseniae]SKA16768.1 D-alanyl-D-alanine carboxypeptidase / D-alanyl-D-alanine-endopeptidase (penicillin-binding protein 4) [Chitinophaga eiseniae]